jgi:hypothetical protein
VVCDAFSRHGLQSQQRGEEASRVSLALKESQPITMGVAGMPLNRDDVTAV